MNSFTVYRCKLINPFLLISIHSIHSYIHTSIGIYYAYRLVLIRLNVPNGTNKIVSRIIPIKRTNK